MPYIFTHGELSIICGLVLLLLHMSGTYICHHVIVMMSYMMSYLYDFCCIQSVHADAVCGLAMLHAFPQTISMYCSYNE